MRSVQVQDRHDALAPMNRPLDMCARHARRSIEAARICVTDWNDVMGVLTSEQLPELNCSVLPHAAERHENFPRITIEIIQQSPLANTGARSA